MQGSARSLEGFSIALKALFNGGIHYGYSAIWKIESCSCILSEPFEILVCSTDVLEVRVSYLNYVQESYM
jgi:hypothetical protein